MKKAAIAGILASIVSISCALPGQGVSLPACARSPNGDFPSEGPIRVFPSEVPELTLDSARWSTRKVQMGLGSSALSLAIEGRILASREIPLGSVAVLFESRRDSVTALRLIETRFSTVRPDVLYKLGRSEQVYFLRAMPSRPAPVQFAEIINLTMAPFNRASDLGCPAQLRIVRQMNLPIYLGLVARVARDSATLLARLRARPGEALRPIEILFDSAVATSHPSGGASLGLDRVSVGVAVNTTGQELHGVAVALIQSFGPGRGDTLVFPVGDVAPHALIPFGGPTAFVPGERRIGWTDADTAPRVGPEYSYRMSAYRRRGNGTLPADLRATDEMPSSDSYAWSPTDFDLDTAMARGTRGVYALLRPPGGDHADLVVIGSKALYRRVSGGQITGDSIRLTYEEWRALDDRAKVASRIAPIVPQSQSSTSTDSMALHARSAAGEEVMALRLNTETARREPLRVVRFASGQPPAPLDPIYKALLEIEKRFRSRQK